MRLHGFHLQIMTFKLSDYLLFCIILFLQSEKKKKIHNNIKMKQAALNM